MAKARARFQAMFVHFTSGELPEAVRYAHAERLFFNDSLKGAGCGKQP